MTRKIYYWKLRDTELQLGEHTLLMGILNITPDSFSDGGRFNDPDRAYARALELEEQGADIIDIGAESTRPGSHRITADEEWQRLVPVLKRLRGNLRVPLSLDTYKSEIADRALDYGVEILNDPSGLTFDPQLAKVAAAGNTGLILNHMRGQPETWAKLPPMQDPAGTVARELEATASRARRAGVERARIVIDPGLGFGKRKEQNAEILAHLRELAALDYPILVGPSRKSFLAQTTEAGKLYATAAAVAAAVLNGAHIVRVHDVKEMQTVVQVAEEIARAAATKPAPVAEERPPARIPTRTGASPEERRRPFDKERPRPFDKERPRPLDRERPRPFESERPWRFEPGQGSPTRPPIAKRDEIRKPQETAERPAEEEIRPAAANARETAPSPRREFPPRANDRGTRPPKGRYPDREKPDHNKRDGSRPPVRPFRSPRPGADRSGGPPRGRDFRPGKNAAGAKDRFRSSGPKRRRPDDDRPRTGGFKSGGFKPGGPKRPFRKRP